MLLGHLTKRKKSRWKKSLAEYKGTDGLRQTHSDLEEGFFTFGLFRR